MGTEQEVAELDLNLHFPKRGHLCWALRLSQVWGQGDSGSDGMCTHSGDSEATSRELNTRR